MSETITTESRPYFECPNNCEEKIFHQFGSSQSTRIMTEDNEIMEDEQHDFVSKEPVRCRICNAMALVKTKITRTIVIIE